MNEANNSTLGFFSRMRDNYHAKFSNLNISHPPEKDGATDDDTLIHNAFVKYFDTLQQPYPEWLGVKQDGVAPARDQHVYSQFQPVRANTSEPLGGATYTPRQLWNRDQPALPRTPNMGYTPQNQTPLPDRPGYSRNPSRLDNLYNKLRQQLIPGVGYQTGNPTRTNTYSATGSRLRERMLNNANRSPR